MSVSPIKKSQILIVDDYPTNIKVLSDLLMEYGFEVLIARDGENALKKLQRITPDIILLDILMPGIDGFETCRRIKEHTSTEGIPVIFMSALSDPVDKIKGLTLGAVDYITKPFQQEEVLARVNTHLKIRNLTKQLEEQNALLQEEVRSRQLAEATLRRSEDKFATAFRANPGPMMILTLEEGRFLDINQNFCTILGYQPELILGQPLQALNILCNPQDSDYFFTGLRENGFIPNRDYQVYSQSGEIRTLLISAAVIYVQEQACILAMAWDVTDCRQAVSELRQAKVTAELANQAKSQFLGHISHELRTPLNSILGYTQLLNRTDDLSPEQQNYVETVHRSGEHLKQLIDDVLAMAKIESGNLTRQNTDVCLPDLLKTLEDMMQPRAAEKNLAFTCDGLASVPTYIRTDGTRLRQILLNLIGNGIKFTDEGHVALTVGVLGQQAQAATEPNLNAGTLLTFMVTDTGPGIVPEDRETIFEPFMQTGLGQSYQEGAGLGLAISREFARLLGGDIELESTPGMGSTFTLTLPVDLAQIPIDAATIAQQSVVGLAPNQPIYRILVVEDQPANRHLLINILTSAGFEVKSAENGQDAISANQNWAPHLILMDLQMPVLDGYQAIQHIRTETDQQPTQPIIIALTANELDAERTAALDGKHDDFLSKPIHEDRLLAKLAEHLDVSYCYQAPKATSTSINDSGTNPQDQQKSVPFTISQTSRENLRKMVGKNETYLNNYISDCLTALPLLFKRLVTAIEGQDWSEIGLAAHSIKGTVLVFGAEQLTTLCQKIEDCAKQEKLSFTGQQLQELEFGLESLLSALKLEL